MSLRINEASSNLNPTTGTTIFSLWRIAHHQQVGLYPSRREFFATTPRRIARSAWSLGLGVALSLGAAGSIHAQARVTVGFASGPTFSRNTPRSSLTNPSARQPWEVERG